MRRIKVTKQTEEHSFSIEMKSEQAVRRMSFFDKENNNILFEGTLGKLKNVSMVEGVMLEVEGINGVLRLDITQQEMEKCLTQKKANEQGGGQQ
jgi:hypothetical protein